MIVALKRKLADAQSEASLHLQTKNDLARELESMRVDLTDQRKTFKASLAAADATIASLTAQAQHPNTASDTSPAAINNTVRICVKVLDCKLRLSRRFEPLKRTATSHLRAYLD